MVAGKQRPKQGKGRNETHPGTRSTRQDTQCHLWDHVAEHSCSCRPTSYPFKMDRPMVLLSKLFGPEGTFYFTSYSPGEHIICLESNSTRFVSVGERRLRIHLDIRVGEHDLDAAIAQAKDKVNEVTFKLEHLMEQIEQILKEQNYQRDREEIFRMTSEDTNSNVLWWAFAQTLIFISVGVFQMKYLKDFFIAKKLV
uniref:GOLD domain-containing protein n=1 Tax=Urocitellus parryii TaxID=9999 RepID=A0A8D2IKX1_UROPR